MPTQTLDELAGLVSKTLGYTPAMKDPDSGRIWSNQLGHKKILNQIARENPTLEKRMWTELFQDNSGKYSPYIGFIDRIGEYLSRKETEDNMAKPRSLVQQFHTKWSVRKKKMAMKVILGYLEGNSISSLQKSSELL